MLVALRRRFGLTAERGLLLIAGLMVLSLLLFVGGVVVERNAAVAATTTCTQHVEGAGESGEGAGARGGASCGETAGSGAGEQQGERVLGVDVENPGVVALIALGWLMLVAGVLRFGRRALWVVIGAASLALIFDVAEVARQVGEHRTAVVIVAALVVVGHGAVIALAAFALSGKEIPGSTQLARLFSR